MGVTSLLVCAQMLRAHTEQRAALRLQCCVDAERSLESHVEGCHLACQVDPCVMCKVVVVLRQSQGRQVVKSLHTRSDFESCRQADAIQRWSSLEIFEKQRRCAAVQCVCERAYLEVGLRCGVERE